MKNIFLLTVTLFCISIYSQTPQQKEIPAPDELQNRFDLTKNRIFKGTCPEFTEDFILCDLQSDPAKQEKRRYSNFSGDFSGRYFSAISRLPQNERPANFQTLMKYALSMQQPDGRFGNSTLIFTPEAIDKNHMALLWGNGRLLVGLLDYYNEYQSSEVLVSAINLANFLIGVANTCANPLVIKKLDGFGAHGFICLTQINEGLVMLAQATKQSSYAEMTRKIYLSLQPRNGQHAHGYLATLRGVMKLYEFDKDITVLAYAKSRYDSLIASPDYKITGGVLEYFGNNPPYEQHDEGCAEADFVMLSFQLWKATRNLEYLEKAESCILNHFYFNQFETGDFGHHVVDGNIGYRLNDEDHKAWWCCTWHGMLGFEDIKKNIVTADSASHKINLYLNTKFADKAVSFEMKKIKFDMPEYIVSFQLPTTAEVALAFRKPTWASTFTMMLNNMPITFEDLNGYCVVNRKWNITDKLKIIMSYKMTFISPLGKEIPSVQIGSQPVDAYMKLGPYLMAVDGNLAGAFLSEPCGGNIVYINDYKKSMELGAGSSIPETYLTFKYKHEGFEGSYNVTLRPIGELGAKKSTYFRALMKFSN
jgi:hypothetical protein